MDGAAGCDLAERGLSFLPSVLSPQGLPSPGSRPCGCRRSFPRCWRSSSSVMAAASSPPWGSWWRGSKPFRRSCQKPSTKSEVGPLGVQKLRARGASWALIQGVVCVSLPLTPSSLCSGPTSSVRGGLLCLMALGFHRDGPFPLRVTAFLSAPHSDS